jgi:hypothetical protein
VVGAGADFAVRTVSVCVKLNMLNVYWGEGNAVAYEPFAEHCGREAGPSAGM